MKVLFNTYPMAFHTPGGGEIQLKSYQSYLPGKDVTVSLLDQWEPNFSDFDLVHFFSCIGGSFAFCGFVKALGLPLLISPNLWITEKTKHLYSIDEIRGHLLLSDGVVVNSDMEGDVLSQVFNIQRDLFHTVYNAVDQHFFTKSDPVLFCDHYKIEEPFILNVGNIEPRKNQLNLIRAMKSFPELKLVIVGHQRDRQYASICFSEAGGQLHYVEALPHDSELLRSAYAACKVFALPSTLETPGIAALEAAAAGAAVVITGEGSTREYFGELVDYVDCNNVREIASAISNAIDRPPSLIGRLYMRANFTWEHVTKRLAELYREVQSGECLSPPQRHFYPMEKTPNGEYFVWSSYRVAFEWEPGRLIFSWHSMIGARVNVLISGELVIEGLEVARQWSTIELELVPMFGQSRVEVVIEITPDAECQSGDSRQLGVAIKNVSFEATIFDVNLKEL